MNIDLENIRIAFNAEDQRLQDIQDALPEEEKTGNDFTICTNGAEWLKNNYFPNAKIMGYEWDNNNSAIIGQWTNGHDFLVINNRYILDFWYADIVCEDINAPVFIDIESEPETVKKWYGDKNKWENLNR